MPSVELPYRPNVCLIILNQANHIFVGERKMQPGSWQLPQGGREGNVSLVQDALREASEETGVHSSLFQVLTILEATNCYDFIEVPDFARGLWRGQFQNFVVLRFLGNEEDIKLDRDQHPEFSNYCWCQLSKIEPLVEPRRLPGYRAALQELQLYLSQDL